MAAGLASTGWDVADLVRLTDEREIMSKWDLTTLMRPHPHPLQPEDSN